MLWYVKSQVCLKGHHDLLVDLFPIVLLSVWRISDLLYEISLTNINIYLAIKLK
jgi:hypothetical protein